MQSEKCTGMRNFHMDGFLPVGRNYHNSIWSFSEMSFFIKILISQPLPIRSWFQSGLKFLTFFFPLFSHTNQWEGEKNEVHWNRFLVCMSEKWDLQNNIGLAQTPLKSNDSHLTLMGFGSNPKSWYHVKWSMFIIDQTGLFRNRGNQKS